MHIGRAIQGIKGLAGGRAGKKEKNEKSGKDEQVMARGKPFTTLLPGDPFLGSLHLWKEVRRQLG